jgi:hypothetical protein
MKRQPSICQKLKERESIYALKPPRASSTPARRLAAEAAGEAIASAAQPKQIRLLKASRACQIKKRREKGR